MESRLKDYCQEWIKFLSEKKFDKAYELVTIPNSYGVRWGEGQIYEAIFEYYDQKIEFDIDDVNLSFCTPEFLACDDGSYLYGFYLPVNGEITDLTVEFEFRLVESNTLSATINDIHVL